MVPDPVTRRRPSAALIGLLAALAALATAELVAGVLGGGRSPVVAVGDVVVDNVPPWLKDLAISWFGTNDKTALLVGILVVLAVVACGIGLLAVRRPAAGVAAIGLFGVVGVVAGLRDEQSTTLEAVLPSLLGAMAGMAVLAFTLRVPGNPRVSDGRATTVERRAFLRMTAVLAVTAVAVGAGGRWLQSQASAVASRAAVMLPRARRPLAAVPTGAELGIDGLSPLITPNRDFYRIDTALIVPQVPAEDWTLKIRGMADNELEITFAELLDRDLVEADVTLTCVSNQIGQDLVGNARWLGFPLATLLEEAGVQPDATQIVPRSVDGYTGGFPTSVALDGRPALVAVGMNGEPLPLSHGFPARLVVPGLYGYVASVKWLKEIELTTLEAFDSYWVPRGYAKEAPIKTMSRIDTPRGLSRLQPGPLPIAGVAWSQNNGGIERVEVQVDDGPWKEATLAEALAETTWRQWFLEWDATPGLHQLRVRATDAAGETQTEERVAPVPDGATGWHSVSVTVESSST
jgi:DMSO/TMAO reductase YedYZ molybdopterin-dependent catalytic subunit